MSRIADLLRFCAFRAYLSVTGRRVGGSGSSNALFREFGKCGCKQHPRPIGPTMTDTDQLDRLAETYSTQADYCLHTDVTKHRAVISVPRTGLVGPAEQGVIRPDAPVAGQADLFAAGLGAN